MKSNIERQGYFVIGAVLAIAIGYPLCAFFPKMRAISRVRHEIHQKQDFVSQTEKLRPVVADQKAALASTFKYIDTQRGGLVAPDKLSQVFSTISKLAIDAGTTTTRFEPHAPVPYDGFRKVPVELGVNGSTAAVQKLLGEIERLPCTIWVEGLKLDVMGQDGETTRCAIELAIFVVNRENSN
jgi:Tfp pilus assembly protein PilO